MEKQLKCVYCEESFPNSTKLVTHLKSAHQGTGWKVVERGEE